MPRAETMHYVDNHVRLLATRPTGATCDLCLDLAQGRSRSAPQRFSPVFEVLLSCRGGVDQVRSRAARNDCDGAFASPLRARSDIMYWWTSMRWSS